ncbi:MAG: SLC13 family permease [Candidatus Binatia bacterium]
MSFDAWVTVIVLIALFGTLGFTSVSTDLALLAGLTLLFTFGVIDMKDALSGFSNEGVITVGVLYVVVAGLQESGGLGIFAPYLLGRPKTLWGAQLRMMAATGSASAFLNNTAVVAMVLPAVSDWAKKLRLSPAKLMIPLSYAAIFGGICTLIGTSTNIVVNGLVLTYARDYGVSELASGLAMFEITKIGLPLGIAGIVSVACLGRFLLPERRPPMEQLSDPREYTVEMVVESGSPLVGKTIEDAGLRHLPGMYLMEIERAGELIVAVDPSVKLEGNDRLVFVGVVESVVDLQKIRGLKPATDQVFKLDAPRPRRCLIEAVVSNSFPYLGKSIRESHFRTIYNAAVIAVARNGERIRKKIGDIVLEQGDTLMLEALPSFVGQQRNSRDFFLVSAVENSRPPHFERAWISVAILIALVVVVMMEWLSMLQGAMLAAGLVIATRCVGWQAARRSISWEVLLAIAASFGIGKAIEVTGLAELMATNFTRLGGDTPWPSLFIIYAMTLLLTELLTNNTAAVLAFPIATATAARLGANPMPFIISVMIAASCGFATPLGYQTHLMVFGPGGYRFADYLRIGIPLDILFLVLTVILVPFIWPFGG